jgi:hypothetical protein
MTNILNAVQCLRLKHPQHFGDWIWTDYKKLHIHTWYNCTITK